MLGPTIFSNRFSFPAQLLLWQELYLTLMWAWVMWPLCPGHGTEESSEELRCNRGLSVLSQRGQSNRALRLVQPAELRRPITLLHACYGLSTYYILYTSHHPTKHLTNQMIYCLPNSWHLNVSIAKYISWTPALFCIYEVNCFFSFSSYCLTQTVAMQSKLPLSLICCSQASLRLMAVRPLPSKC